MRATKQRDCLNRFYDLIENLMTEGKTPSLADLTATTVPYGRGIYFFFELGENRSNGKQMRVTRVGTHGVSAGSKATLWNRLRTHRGTTVGGGNHRSSIFRSHVGAALISSGAVSGDLETWQVQGSASASIREAEVQVEQEVSRRIAAMRVALVGIPDEPGPRSDRAFLERHSIGLLSTLGREVDPPSRNWLGLCSNRPEIRSSGLWNLDHLQFPYSESFLDVLEAYVESMASGRPPKTSIAPRDWWVNSNSQISLLA